MLYKLCEVLSFWHVFLLCVQFYTPLLCHSRCHYSECSFPFLSWDALYEICYLIQAFNRFSSIESFTISSVRTIHCTDAISLKPFKNKAFQGWNLKTLKQKNTHPQFNNKPQPHDINKKLKQRNQGKSSLCESTVRIRVNSCAKLKRQSKRHWKGTVKTRRIAYAARIHVKTQPFCKPGKKALEKHNIFCNWRIAEKLCKIQGPCPCQNGRQLPSNLWMRRGDVTRSKNSKNELDIWYIFTYI